MKKVLLKSLRLKNFKGIKNASFEFNSISDIFGDNGTGKTTLFDSFTWLLFGKDHTDAQKFDIKTLDADNNPIHKLEHTVEGVLEVDGLTYKLTRTYKERWTKKRGSIETVMDGHTTDFFIDDVPENKTSYAKRVSELVDESLFKLLSNPFHFASIKWEDRRTILSELVGGFDALELLDLPKYSVLKDILSNKELEGYRRELKVKKDRLKKELEAIPIRIDEKYETMPEAIDVDSINKEAEELKAKRVVLQSEIEDIRKRNDTVNQGKLAIDNSIAGKERAINSIKNNLKSDSTFASDKYASDLKRAKDLVGELETRVRRGNEYIDSIKVSIEGKEARKKSLSEEWDLENSKMFSIPEGAEDGFKCPTCGTPWSEEEISSKKAQMEVDFNKNQRTKLEAITTDGKAMAKQILNLEGDLDKAEAQLSSIKKDLTEAQSKVEELEASPVNPKDIDVESNEDIIKLRSEIATLKEQVNQDVELESVEVQKEQIEKIDEEILALRMKLGKQDVRNNDLKRIEELEAMEKDYANQLVELEKSEFLVENYVSDKINSIEKKINILFSNVQFRLFEQQINGGVRETCDILIKGVPFDSANNAGKINAGLEIVKVLSSYHEVNVPIFIDNAESVVRLQETGSQQIRLYVSEKDFNLRVVNHV